MTKTIPYFELELVGIFAQGTWTVTNPNARVHGDFVIFPVAELEPGSESAQAVRDNVFAEVNIPYRADRGSDDDAGYTYTFHLFNKPNSLPAIPEMMLLKELIPAIHQDFQGWAVRRGVIEVEDE